MQNFAEYIGLFAGMCTTLSVVPQIIKTYRTKSVRDISVYMYILSCIGLTSWLIYGMLISSIPLILANTVSLVFAMSMLSMKILWNEREERTG